MQPAQQSETVLVRTWDKSYIRSIFAAPEIYPHIADDFTPAKDRLDPPLHEHVIYLRPFEGGAIFMLHPQNAVLWSLHGGVLLTHRNKSKEYTTACVEWMRKNTRARCIMALVLSSNLPPQRLLESIGFIKTGDVARSAQVGGELKDQLLYVRELTA